MKKNIIVKATKMLLKTFRRGNAVNVLVQCKVKLCTLKLLPSESKATLRAPFSCRMFASRATYPKLNVIFKYNIIIIILCKVRIDQNIINVFICIECNYNF